MEKLKIDTSRYEKRPVSFSCLSNFCQCKYCHMLKYFLSEQQREDAGYIKEGNFWAENGSLVHNILEQFFKDWITLDELPTTYIERYESEICCEAKPSIMESTMEKCVDYFATVDFEYLRGWKVIGVEMKIDMEIFGVPFIGFIDLLLYNESTDEYWIIDHKSSDYPFGKKGQVLAKAKKDFEKYKYQMYLYSHSVKELYGKFPSKISWNHFKDGRLATIPFNEDEYEETMKWFKDTLLAIDKEEEFEPSMDYFYCHNLCDFRNSCEYLLYPDEEGDE